MKMTNIAPEPRAEATLASWTRTIKRSALQKMLAAASQPGIISFALGLPAPELFPVGEFEQAVTSVLASDARALQYQPQLEPLKKHVVELMKHRGVICREEQVFLTAGAQQGMNLLVHLLLEPGGKVLIEQLIYTGFQQLIEPFQPEILAVPTDAETGMDVDAVEELLKNGARPSFIYAITDGHNPMSVSMLRSKRERLVELACYYGVPIIEDDAYGFLSYDGVLEPPLRALNDQWVFYVGSFSKILAPALRVGWVIVPERLIQPLSVIKEATDIDTATFTQRIVSAYLDAGHLPEHLMDLRREYKIRRDTMHRTMRQYFPPQAQWREPRSGVFFWVELPNMPDTDELLRLAIERERVAFIPGHAFSVGPNRFKTQSLRLNFSHCTLAVIEEGISRLARALSRCSH